MKRQDFYQGDVITAGVLDEKGRCCGRKPLVYKRPASLFCCRCDREFDPLTGRQQNNWAWSRLGEAQFVRIAGRLREGA